MTTVHRKFETWFAEFAAWVYERKYAALACMLLMTLGLAIQIPKLTIDTRDESLFHHDDPALIAYNTFRDTFGQDDMFIIAMKPQNGLTKDFFATLYQIHHELEASAPYLDDITSLVNGRIIRAEGDTLIVENLMKRPPKTDIELHRILKLINHYPLYEKLLVSKDRSIISIFIRAQAVKKVSEDELLAGFEQEGSQKINNRRIYLSNAENVKIYEAIRKVAARYQGRGIEFHFTGTPAFVAEIQKGIEEDMKIMLPLSFFMIVLFLAILFRRISGVIYPLVIVSFSLVSCLGIMAMAAMPITNASQILPIFLIVVGIGDSVHILTIFYRLHRNTNDKRRAIIQAVRYAGLPVLMTSVTTACGLVSFAWADVAVIAQLGYIAPVGVMLAFFYTVVLLPALIAVFPIRQAKSFPKDKQLIADRLFDAIARVTTRRPMVMALISTVILVVVGFSAFSVRFSHNALTWFPQNAPIRVSTNLLDNINGGTVMLEITVDSGTENGLYDPDLLRRLDEAAAFVPGVKVHGIQAGKAWSISDVLKEINRALHEDRNDAYRVPTKRETIAQELILFESSGSEDLEDFTDSTYQTARLSILAPFTDSVLYKDYVEKVKGYLDKQFPHETVILTGHMALFVKITKNFITSMAKSYGFALLVITFLMVLMIGRIRIGLMSMVANVVPIICIFGIMGSCRIPLDMYTIMIGSIVLGLVVDDTIQFLHHFRRAYDETASVEFAVRETLHSTGRALVITSLVLCGGFFIYTTSYLTSNVRFGVLTGSAVLFALAADFFLVPALLSLAYGKRTSIP
ncbi:MAG: MMPL family transporter [Thermodesulfobacteriota bacterium]|nr:MMPL family transporter [Thermodesulfobacteriota bacterium]